MKKPVIIGLILAALASTVAFFVTRKKDVLDEEDDEDYDEIFGNNEGDVDVEVRDYISASDIDVPTDDIAEETVEETIEEPVPEFNTEDEDLYI